MHGVGQYNMNLIYQACILICPISIHVFIKLFIAFNKICYYPQLLLIKLSTTLSSIKFLYNALKYYLIIYR